MHRWMILNDVLIATLERYSGCSSYLWLESKFYKRKSTVFLKIQHSSTWKSLNFSNSSHTSYTKRFNNDLRKNTVDIQQRDKSSLISVIMSSSEKNVNWQLCRLEWNINTQCIIWSIGSKTKHSGWDISFFES